jgi:hypothetical protein
MGGLISLDIWIYGEWGIGRRAKEKSPKSGSVTPWGGRALHFSGWTRTTICTRSAGLAPPGGGTGRCNRGAQVMHHAVRAHACAPTECTFNHCTHTDFANDLTGSGDVKRRLKAIRADDGWHNRGTQVMHHVVRAHACAPTECTFNHCTHTDFVNELTGKHQPDNYLVNSHRLFMVILARLLAVESRSGVYSGE